MCLRLLPLATVVPARRAAELDLSLVGEDRNFIVERYPLDKKVRVIRWAAKHCKEPRWSRIFTGKENNTMLSTGI